MDSAGGSAKQGRDRKTQAILPLKGKVLNIEKEKDPERIASNNEIKSIIQALGCGFGDNYDASSLKYHKLIIMTDSDADGSHITSLLITCIYKLFPQIIKDGHLYVANPPLFRIQWGPNVEYVKDEKERDKIIAKLEKQRKNYVVQRFKGLGEMDPEQLRDTTMDPKNRILTRVTMKNIKQAERMISMMMGSNVNARKEYVDKHYQRISLDEIL